MGVLKKALEMLTYPEEIGPMYRMYAESKRVQKLARTDSDLQFCYSILNNVSRSFAMVIQQLPECLRDATCVFYLVLRALDTVEDDMALSNNIKIPLLHTFHDKLKDESFTVSDCGEKDYKLLLEQFPRVVRVNLKLTSKCQTVIKDICHRMGVGMAEFIDKEVMTIRDYDLYCHYVAGLVGLGLSQLFAATHCEDSKFETGMDDLANHMGLFLQKTNIIRDYLEDIVEEPAPRMFWPKEIWGKYANELADFKYPENRTKAVTCLNHMITNALTHAPKALEYMTQLRNPRVFSFCAIPQIMAIATLTVCYNNGRVFEGVVKLRRGQTAVVFEQAREQGALYQQFYKWALELQHKALKTLQEGDPTAEQCIANLNEVLEACTVGTDQNNVPLIQPNHKGMRILVLILCVLYLVYAYNAAAVRDMLGVPHASHSDVIDKFQPALAGVLLAMNVINLFGLKLWTSS